jgi:hypothetical protein
MGVDCVERVTFLFIRYPVFGNRVWVENEWFLDKRCKTRRDISDVG